MAWSVLQSASGTQATAATTLAVTYGSNVSSGSKLIALVAIDAASGSVSSVKDGAGNSFTSLASVSGTSGGASEMSLWAIDTPAGDVGTKPAITATFTSGEASMLIQEVSGLLAGNTTAMRDGTAGTVQETTTASQSQPAYSSTASNEYLVACFGDNGGAETYSAPSGYTADSNGVNNNISADCVIAYKNSTNGAESGTWTFTGTLTGACYIVVAFKLATVTTPPLPVNLAPYRPPVPPVQIPPQVIYPPAVQAFAQLATGTGAALSPSAAIVSAPPLVQGALRSVVPVQVPPQAIFGPPPAVPGTANAGLATGTGAALSPMVATPAGWPLVEAPYRPAPPPVQIPPQVIYPPAVTVNAGLATGTGAALQASVATSVSTGLPLAQSELIAYPAPVQIAPQVIFGPPPAVPGTANAQLASGTGAALGPSVAITVNAGLATGTGAALAPQGATGADAGLATGTGAALAPVPAIGAEPQLATGTGAALSPGAGYGAGLATGTGAALTASLAIAANAAAATALGIALNATGASVLPFTVGQLTASTAAAGATAGTLTASTAPGSTLTASTEP